MRKICLFTFFLVFLNACVFIPKKLPNNTAPNSCQMVNKEYTLEAEQVVNFGAHCDSGACLIALLGIPVLSLVVSGTIVLIGNTIHWVEYYSSCENEGTVKL